MIHDNIGSDKCSGVLCAIPNDACSDMAILLLKAECLEAGKDTNHKGKRCRWFLIMILNVDADQNLSTIRMKLKSLLLKVSKGWCVSIGIDAASLLALRREDT